MAACTMNTTIEVFNTIVTKVRFFFKKLHLNLSQRTGRTLAIAPHDMIALSLFKQSQGIETKKSVWQIFRPNCTYKTLVVNMNRFGIYALIILNAILRTNRTDAHIVKHTDATDIPVCLLKNASTHRTMKQLSGWGKSGKGWYYGLKLHITTDLRRKLLAISFSSGNGNDREIFKHMNKALYGIFVADAGYISKDLEHDFFIEQKRILLAKAQPQMKRIATQLQGKLYETRMLIELNFRNLKMFYGLITSLPRSVDGYCAHYIYALLAYVLR